MTTRPTRLGLRENAAQFSVLVVLNALVGSMVGLERSVLPVIGRQDFGLASKAAILSFIAAFGLAKAPANLVSGSLAARFGRKHILLLGWLLALPVPVMIGFAPSWEVIVAANVLLGASQGLTWSMTVVMKVDLVGPRRRGLALGLNESAGYLGVAGAAFVSGVLAASFAPRTVIWAGSAGVAVLGLLLAVLVVRDTTAHVAVEQQLHGPGQRGTLLQAVVASVRAPVLRACSQAGLANNLNDALAWGLAPLYLAAHGASPARIGVVAAVYPAVWGLGQLGTGWLSDIVGRKLPIAAGMLLQGGALALLVVSNGGFTGALLAAVLLGVGTAFVYPTLIAAVSDVVTPLERAQAIGVYRFWRDSGLVVGAVLTGVVADAIGTNTAIAVVAGLTAASGLWVLATRWPAAIVSANDPYRRPGLDGRSRRPYALGNRR